MHLKKVIKIGEFLCIHFNIEDGRKYTHFWHITLYYFKKCKNEICAVYGEGAVTDRMCQKGFEKFCAGDFLVMLHGWVDQLKLIVIKSRH